MAVRKNRTMDAVGELVLDRPITVAEWEALEDPDGGRFEILDGRLIVSPSGDADHSRFGEDLADQLRVALQRAGMDLPVTLDVEWRTVAADVVVQAPRGDVVVGRSLDPRRRIHDAVPLLVIEVWSARTPWPERNARRSYWATRGLAHYWELHLADDADHARLDVHDLRAGETLLQSVTGWASLAISEPFPVEVQPAAIHGWTARQFELAEARITEAEARVADAETRIADLEDLLRSAGIDPDVRE
jgi:Uma2 family endonuclease